MTRFTFGKNSKRHLDTVDHHLHRLCNRALKLSLVDFGIVSGRRTEDEQAGLVEIGASQTMDSKHLQGNAIDFMPFWGGKYQEAWPFYYPVASAFLMASKELETPIRWGGSWGMDLWAFRTIQEAQEAYLIARANQGKTSCFFDGGHIELVETIST